MKFDAEKTLTLRDMRLGKGVPQTDLAKMLGVSQAYYAAIEAGHKRPNIDTLHALAVLYGTSMDYVYHAYYRQSIKYHMPDASLEYGMRTAMKYDADYLRTHYPAPISEP